MTTRPHIFPETAAPSHTPDGTMNLVGALRKAMGTTGYTEVKEFQRVEIVVHA